MSETPADVLVAGYQDIVAARRDFDGLVELVKAKTVKVEGVILVAHDQDGNVTVVDTGDHVGRKGAGWGAGVGLVVGLFAPPLLASVAVGAAGGAVVGKFADHQLKAGIRDKIGEALPPGSAGIIAVFDDDQRLAFEQALTGARLKSVVQSGKDGLVRHPKGLNVKLRGVRPVRRCLARRLPRRSGCRSSGSRAGCRRGGC
jgi:uncharacterized membrane protein